jgi:hypothetical protein
VHGNLCSVLEPLHLKERRSNLWVDIICIDQANNTEKSHQVRLMQQICQNASRVVMFVGKELRFLASYSRLMTLLLPLSWRRDNFGQDWYGRATTKPRPSFQYRHE